MEEAKTGKKGQTTMVNPDGTVNVPNFKSASKQYQNPPKYK